MPPAARKGPNLGGLDAASADEAGAKDALVAQNARAAVLHAIKERPEVCALLLRLRCYHLAPLPADLQRRMDINKTRLLDLRSCSFCRHACNNTQGEAQILPFLITYIC